MPSHANPSQDPQRRKAVANPTVQKSEEGDGTAFSFVDNRPEARRLARLQELMRNNAPAQQIAQRQAALQMKADSALLRRQPETSNDDLLPGRSAPVQKQGIADNEVVQGLFLWANGLMFVTPSFFYDQNGFAVPLPLPPIPRGYYRVWDPIVNDWVDYPLMPAPLQQPVVAPPQQQPVAAAPQQQPVAPPPQQQPVAAAPEQQPAAAAPQPPPSDCTGLGSYDYQVREGVWSRDHHITFQDGTRWHVHYEPGSRRIRHIRHEGGPMRIDTWGVGLNQRGMPRSEMRNWFRDNQPAALPYFQSFMDMANAAGE